MCKRVHAYKHDKKPQLGYTCKLTGICKQRLDCVENLSEALAILGKELADGNSELEDDLESTKGDLEPAYGISASHST